MAPKRIIKVSHQDEASFVLIQVSSKGSKPLDLKLVGTEGEAPYVCSLRHDRVASLRTKNCPVSETEWQNILRLIFEQQPQPDIQATATIQTESSLSITVRKQVQGITQRLGTITLNHDPGEAIELLDWCASSVDAAARSIQTAGDYAAKLQDLQASVDELKSQLEELIRAKQEDELELLQKFRSLLNEKKVKIREQQKIITELSVNAGAWAAPSVRGGSEEPPASDKAGGRKSKAPKRKAKAVESDDLEDDVAAVVKSEPEDSDAGHTTEETASAAGGDDDDDDDDDDEDENMGEPQEQAAPEPQLKKNQAAGPPPPRSLPFQSKKPAAVVNESSDDEL
ncbi:uncharacterized protein UV8b_08133 [Ustilaginoidea virens]|uniref:XRCC4 coiled-coil domain-containing protein n=1 Tax=Ustilaginoidea virens TaxID=1159556 RepID=A0A063CAE1_USTVR|nr:uncharacterized protein UV8b_08133 [Ustilaginoidea virens]QUC23892.1 hypothetical protein UV8b_08133 [Ustilaginoidea virens]GAO14268.1 hypothetical protein UVI_02001010 [Ustilaginoidea virens]